MGGRGHAPGGWPDRNGEAFDWIGAWPWTRTDAASESLSTLGSQFTAVEKQRSRLQAQQPRPSPHPESVSAPGTGLALLLTFPTSGAPLFPACVGRISEPRVNHDACQMNFYARVMTKVIRGIYFSWRGENGEGYLEDRQAGRARTSPPEV